MRYLALALVVGCASTHTPLRTKGLESSVSTADALRAALESRRVAVLVGVDEYSDAMFPPLKHAVGDAEALAALFNDRTGGDFDEVTVISNGEATRSGVIAQLRRLRANLHPDDVVVFYISGHGTRVADSGIQKRFLVMHDTSSRDLEGSGLELSALQQFFGTLAPQRKALIIDACFNGDGKSSVRPHERQIPIEGSGLPSIGILSGGEAHIYATSSGRPALEDDELGHGVYTHYLLDAMSWSFQSADRDRDGVVTAWEAHDYARLATMEHTSGMQVPEAAMRVVGMADLILAGTQKARKRRDDALVYLYGPESSLAGASITVDGRPRGVLPGTVPVSAGRHQITIGDTTGKVIASGSVTLSAGRPYRAEELTRVLRGPEQSFSIRSGFIGVPALKRTIPGLAPGLELSALARDNEAPGRGLFAGGHLGMFKAQQQTIEQSRSILVVGMEVGIQQDWRRWRWRLSGVGDGVLVPRSWPDGRPDSTEPLYARDHLDEAGWWFMGLGPSLSLGWVATETVSVEAGGRVMGSFFDAQSTGAVSPGAWGVVNLGISFSL